uniref:Innexin n=1 Tax=Hirudo verbana TaxID=311461 RepID=H9C4R6_9ANNE|nr:INX16 [Hirudo verbana]
MDRLFKSVLSIRELKFHVDDDYVDRLSRQYTVVLMVLFAFLVSTKQFVGSPINCWCPAEFKESHVDYTNAVCWVSNTYYLNMGTPIPNIQLDTALPPKQRISYYQWVPLILIVQGVLSFVPCQIWRFLNKRSGINLSTIMDAAHVSSEAAYLEIREKAVRYVVNQMDRYLMAQRDHRTGCCVRVKHFVAKLCCVVGGRLYGNYLITAYLFIKTLYIANAIGQLFLLDLLLVNDFHMYGAFIVERLLKGQDWTESEIFPRVTLCEYQLRHHSRLHSYIVQCALSINLFNEKIFFFVWFWFVFLAMASLVNFFQWLFKALYWPGQVQYVRKQIRAFDSTQQREHGVLAKFTECYLRRDGMFIVRLIGINMGEVAAGEVLCGLWNNYSPERRLISEKPGRKQYGSRQGAGRQMGVA